LTPKAHHTLSLHFLSFAFFGLWVGWVFLFGLTVHADRRLKGVPDPPVAARGGRYWEQSFLFGFGFRLGLLFWFYWFAPATEVCADTYSSMFSRAVGRALASRLSPISSWLVNRPLGTARLLTLGLRPKYSLSVLLVGLTVHADRQLKGVTDPLCPPQASFIMIFAKIHHPKGSFMTLNT